MNRNMENHSELSTTSSLIVDLKGFSTERWQHFVLLYGPLLRYWIQSKSIAHPSDEDILQECFISIAKGIADFERGSNGGTFRGWLKTIVNRRVADHYRKIAQEKYIDPPVLDLNISGPEWLDMDEERETNDLVELEARALVLLQNSVSEKTWQIFRMSVVEKIPTSEIAESVGITQAGVRVAKGRVLKRLREMMLDRFERHNS